MIKLKPCPVVFDEIEHTYTLGEKNLSGVTALLKRQLFSGKYSAVPKSYLDAAAERGNSIHRQIEMYESFGTDIHDIEVDDYIRLKAKWKFRTVATEWLVSDNDHVASSIDNVFERDGEFGVYLWDTKTTSSLDREYLSWQLSIYKYLFLLANPDIPVLGLGATWLPDPKKGYGKSKMVEIAEKPVEWVKEIIACDKRGEQWVNPETALQSASEETLAIPQELTRAVADFLRAEKQAKEMKERLREIMEENGVTKWENDDFVASMGKPSESLKFDQERFRTENPDLFDSYTKTVPVKGRFTIKLK